jgi:hypothetical protein
MSQHPIALMLSEIDASRPAERDEAGRPFYTVRARVPFTIGTSALRDAIVRPHTSSASPVDTRAAKDCESCGGSGKMEGADCDACGGKGKRDAPTTTEERAAADGPVAGPKVRGPRIEGIASSTGRDCYGTEMSKACLDGMAGQFRSGSVVYLAKHPSYFAGDGEWDDVMGYVYDGTVQRGEVADNTNPGEFSYILRVGVQLDEKHPKANDLAERVADGHQIGQSIGGWFTKLTFVWPAGTTEDEKFWSVDPERIIVEEVELDHLAATRRPANVESWIEGVRSALRDHGAKRIEARSRAAAPPVARTEPVEAAAPVVEAAPEPVAAPEPESPAVVAEPPAGERSEPVEPPSLDTSAATGNDADVPTSGSDAQEALPQERNEPSQEQPMSTDPALLELLSGMKQTLDVLVQRAAPVAASPAPAAEPPAARAAPAEDPEVVRLRAENERLRSDLSGALAAPNRRGLVTGYFPAERASVDAEVNALLVNLDGESRGRRLGAVIRSRGFMDRRTEADGPAKVTKSSVESDLRSLLGAACDDGLIRTPDAIANWS